VPGDQIEVNPIGLILVVPTCQIHKFGVPQAGYCGTQMGTVACPIFDWVNKVLEDMHTDMTHVGTGVDVSV
jgi:hypothetical protein